MTNVFISTVLYGNDNLDLIAKTIEITPIPVGVEYFAFEINQSEQAKLCSAHNRFATTPSTYHSPMVNAEPTTKEDSPMYKDLIANWTQSLQLAKQFGSKQMVFHSNNCFVEKQDKPQLQRCAVKNGLTLNRLCNTFGLTMLVETLALPCRGEPIFTDKEFVKYVCDNNLSALIDIGHMNLNGYDYEFVLSSLKDRIKAYHVHNNDGANDTHDVIDRGTFDYGKFIDCYRKYTPDADLVFEYIDVKDLTPDKLSSDIMKLYNAVNRG